MDTVLGRCFYCRRLYTDKSMHPVVVKDFDKSGFETKLCTKCLEDINGIKKDDNAASSEIGKTQGT